VTFEGHIGDLLTVVTLREQITRDLLAIAKFLSYHVRNFFCNEKTHKRNKRIFDSL